MYEGDKYHTEPFYNINIYVTGNRIFIISIIKIKNKAIKDFTKRMSYFDKLLPSFSKPAHEVYTRLIYFLKYFLYNPYLIEFPEDHVFFIMPNGLIQKVVRLGQTLTNYR